MASARSAGCSKRNRHISKYVEGAAAVRRTLLARAPHIAAIVIGPLVAQNHAQ